MKLTTRIMSIIAVALLLAGCAGMDTQEKRCATYGDMYALYLATVEVRPVSAEESAAAAAAAIFLRAYCGWTGPRGIAVTDTNGVPVIMPPK